MMHPALNNQRVLAIDPCSKGFGFVVLEGPKSLIDYGVNSATGDKNSVCLKKIAELMEYYQPDGVILESATSNGSRRCPRVKQLIGQIEVLASTRKVKTRSISRLQVKKAFGHFGASSKYQIALTLATCFPELIPLTPRKRKPWMTEEARMSIFDAVALALTSFFSQVKLNLQRHNPK